MPTANLTLAILLVVMCDQSNGFDQSCRLESRISSGSPKGPGVWRGCGYVQREFSSDAPVKMFERAIAISRNATPNSSNKVLVRGYCGKCER